MDFLHKDMEKLPEKLYNIAISHFRREFIMKHNDMLAMILAGGRGSRLHDLTNKVAKPAVSYGGKLSIFRLVTAQIVVLM